MKIKSATKKGSLLYADLSQPTKGNSQLLIPMSGFSGGLDFELFKCIKEKFPDDHTDTLTINFCDEENKKDYPHTMKTEDYSLGIYSRELKNIIDLFIKKYSNIVLIGHSFGAIIGIKFLTKYPKYQKKINLVIWDPSLLPWGIKTTEENFAFDKKNKLYKFNFADFYINKKFYKELAKFDSVKYFGKIKTPTLIVAAENSADKDSKKYLSHSLDKKNSKLVILKNTDHFFTGSKTRKILLKETADFIKSSQTY